MGVIIGDVLLALILMCTWVMQKKGESRLVIETFFQGGAVYSESDILKDSGGNTSDGKTEENTSAVKAEENEEIKKICLTFDDGPHPYYTEQLLDGLKERGVKATFFVTGEHAEQLPDVIKRMHEEGHIIGNHTYSHIQLKSSNREQFKEELVKTNEIIKGITGEEVTYVRPPYGTWDKTFEKELNMIPVLWNIDPLDWCSDDAICVAGKVIDKAQENDIILLHDYYESSVTAALEIVDELLEDGFVFVTVEEVLFD